VNKELEQIGRGVLDSAFRVHSVLGPGLLESVYEAALAVELTKRRFTVERQRLISVYYEGTCLDGAFRADLIINNLVLVELKSVEAITDFFKKVTLNYLKLIPLQLGFLINFNESHLRNGITRITNGAEGKEFFLREEEAPYFAIPSSPSRSSRDPASEFSAQPNVSTNHL
jgi:GxxExxY protein